jgi:hypothetical protein
MSAHPYFLLHLKNLKPCQNDTYAHPQALAACASFGPGSAGELAQSAKQDGSRAFEVSGHWSGHYNEERKVNNNNLRLIQTTYH